MHGMYTDTSMHAIFQPLFWFIAGDWKLVPGPFTGFIQSMKVSEKKVLFRLVRESHGKLGIFFKSQGKFVKSQGKFSVSSQLLLNV